MSVFDNIIKQKADGHQSPVPPDAWDNIIKKKKRRSGIFWWTMICMLLCGLGIAGYYRLNGRATGISQTADIKPAQRMQIPTAVSTNISNKKILPAHQKSQINAPGQRFQTPHVVGANTVNSKTPIANKQSQIDKPGQRFQTPAVVGANTVNSKTAIADPQSQSDKSRGRLPDPTAVHTNTLNNNKTFINQQSQNYEPGRQLESPVAARRRKTKNKESNIEGAIATNTFGNKAGGAFGKKTKIQKQADRKTHLTIYGSTPSVDEPSVNKNSEKSPDSLSSNDLVKNNDNNDTIEVINPKSKENLSAPEKELVVDSAKKILVTTAPVENKKVKNAVNKPVKQKAWFIDAGVSPVLPIQQPDREATFSRTQAGAGSKSVFTGKLANSTMDPAIAYSIALREMFGTKLSLGAGLQYLKLHEQLTISGTEINTKYTIVDRLVDNIGGPQLISDTIAIVSEGNRKITAVNSYTFLTIPVFIQYDFIQKRSWSFGLVAGAYINIFGKYENEINRNRDAQLTATGHANNEKNAIGAALYGGFRFGKKSTKN